MRVLPDVAGLDKTFDYLVPAPLAERVQVGTLVRVGLQGRRVGGWVVADDVDPPPGVVLRPLAGVTGWGPPPVVVDLATWASWRWAGRPARFLRAASPATAVRSLPTPPARPAPPVDCVADPVIEEALAGGPAVLRLPPASDLLPLAAAAARRGGSLILTPSISGAAGLAKRLRRLGVPVALLPGDWAQARAGGCTVVGTRAAAWAPVTDLAAVVVLDGHDEAYQEERAPTWNARDVALERARRSGVPCVVASPCPDLVTLAAGRLVVPGRKTEREGWPVLDVADRRRDDPRTGLYGPALVNLVRGGRRVVCVLNRKGRARMLACGACRELTRCERCQAALHQSTGESDGSLECRRCGDRAPWLCPACGSQRLKVLRVGVSRVRQELEALVGVTVGEVTADSAEEEVAGHRVLIGTEAVLHRVDAADAVAFVDFDQELMAPRYRAAEQALALLARAGRLVGGRDSGGRVLVQTRVPDHPVLTSALHGDPARLSAVEAGTRADLRLPPATAIARVSGRGAASFVERLVAARPPAVEVLGPSEEGQWLLRAPDHAGLCDALAGVARPAERHRVEVDPLRV